MTTLPLQGIRILAIEQYGAGPYGSMYLAELGAEVIKIENPKARGDIARQTGPYLLGDNDSLFFQTFNQNKKSLSLDLKTPQGREIFAKLVISADAVLNNLRGDQPDKLGITYDALKSLNPKIVCAHLSAYGRDNDRAHWPGYDYLMQAEAGLMSLTGEPEQAPSRFGVSMIDFMSGAVTAMGVTAAMLGAHRQGQGCDVDVSLFDVALHQLSYPATWYLNTGHITERTARSAHPSTVPCQLYTTADGHIFVMAMTEKFWQALIDILADQRLRDMKFATVETRRQHRQQLSNIIDSILSTKNTEHWLSKFAGKLPSAPVHNLQQALTNPYLQQVGMIQHIAHPESEQLQVLANPIKVNGQRLSASSAAGMGADTDDVLRHMGYQQEHIEQLRASGAI
ncbi:CaiB/BaiF CoA transferase family protein [Thalassotalea maritima]|uniref:CaiB/BaiF CoA transferase family protein n=1 Tax=Thalassotalea maritima TaxID=3242416 RepID=UPI003528F653